jgi:hypothetical protein
VSESNGVFKLSSMGTGKWKVQFGEEPDLAVVEIDVIEQYNLYSDLIDKFRNDKGEIDKNQYTAIARAKWGFVGDVIKAHVAQALAEKLIAGLTNGAALYFCKGLQDEANRMLPFFRLASEAEPSSPESLPTVHYST